MDENEADEHEEAHELHELDFRRLKTFQTKILTPENANPSAKNFCFLHLSSNLSSNTTEKALLRPPRKSAARAEAEADGKATAQKAQNLAVLFVGRGLHETDST